MGRVRGPTAWRPDTACALPSTLARPHGGVLRATCLPPTRAGMNKMVINHLERLFVTSDASTIVTELEVNHPAARLIVHAAKAQEQEIGDGTNLVGRASCLFWASWPPSPHACSPGWPLNHAALACRCWRLLGSCWGARRGCCATACTRLRLGRATTRPWQRCALHAARAWAAAASRMARTTDPMPAACAPPADSRNHGEPHPAQHRQARHPECGRGARRRPCRQQAAAGRSSPLAPQLSGTHAAVSCRALAAGCRWRAGWWGPLPARSTGTRRSCPKWWRSHA